MNWLGDVWTEDVFGVKGILRGLHAQRSTMEEQARVGHWA